MADAYDGFREFFAARRSALSRAAFFLAGSESDAEDLLQDALAKAAARWPGLRDQNPEAYVRQVMLNAVRSRWRRRQKISEQPTAGEVPERPILGEPESDAVTLDGDRVLSYTVQDNKLTLIGDRGRLIYRVTSLVRAT